VPDRSRPSPARPVPLLPLRPLLPLWAAAIASVSGGLLLTLAFPSLSWWPLAFVSVPLALVSLIGRRIGGAVLIGLLFGVGLFFVNFSFTARYLGPVPWIALSGLESVLTAVMAVPIALAYRWLPRWLPGVGARLLALPALVAGLWVSREELQGTFPYGGFPWTRVAVTQADSPLVHLTSWTGMSGLSFLMVFACAAAIEAARLVRFDRPRGVRAAVVRILPAGVSVLALFLIPAFPTTDAGSIHIGAVQGNGPAGYFDERAPYDVFRAQLAATRPIEDQDVDVLLWPEGGIDADPLSNRSVRTALDALASRVDAPLLVSGVTQRGDQYYNSSLLWEKDADNPVALYDKRHPVPFGEYVPDRWFYNMLAPDLIGLIQREYTPGTTTPMFDIGGVGVGLAICFDVIYDDVIREGAFAGAEVYMFQTNNADFRGTDENLQQLAFARIRAVESGRAVVNLSTVGTSQVIGPDGRTIDALPADEPGAMVTVVPLRTGLTPGILLGGAIQTLLGWGSIVALAAVGLIVRRRARTPKTPTPAGAGVEAGE